MTGLPLGDMSALRRAAARLHDTEMPPQAYGLVIGWIDPLITYIDHLERELGRARTVDPAGTAAALRRVVRAAGAFLPLIPGGDDDAEAELRAAIAAIPAAHIPPSANTTTGTKT